MFIDQPGVFSTDSIESNPIESESLLESEILASEDNTALRLADLKTFEPLFFMNEKAVAEEEATAEHPSESKESPESPQRPLTFFELQKLAVLVQVYQGADKDFQGQLANSLRKTHYHFQAWDLLVIKDEKISDDAQPFKKKTACFTQEKIVDRITQGHFVRLAVLQAFAAQSDHLLISPGGVIGSSYLNSDQFNLIAMCVAAGFYFVRLCLAISLSVKDYRAMSSRESRSASNFLTFVFRKGPYSNMIINDIVWCALLVACAVGSYIFQWNPIISPAFIAFGYLVDVVNFGVAADRALNPYRTVLKELNTRINTVCEILDNVNPSNLTLSNLDEQILGEVQKNQLRPLLQQKFSIDNTMKKMKQDHLYSNRLRIALMLGKILLATAPFAPPPVAALLALLGALIVLSARVGRVKEMAKHSVQESDLKKKVQSYRIDPSENMQKAIDVLSSLRYVNAVQHVCFELGVTGVSMALTTALATGTTAFLVSNPVGVGLLIVGASLLALALVIWCVKEAYVRCATPKFSTAADTNNTANTANTAGDDSVKGSSQQQGGKAAASLIVHEFENEQVICAP